MQRSDNAALVGRVAAPSDRAILLVPDYLDMQAARLQRIAAAAGGVTSKDDRMQGLASWSYSVERSCSSVLGPVGR